MFTIRPYNPTTEEEYAALVAIHNAAWPDDLSTISSWQFHDSRWPDDKLRQRFVVEDDGQLITEGAYMAPFWSNAPGKFLFGYSSLPVYEERAELHQFIYDYVLEQLAQDRPQVLGTYTREDRLFRVQWLESNGFVVKIREPISELDITNVDFSRFNGA
ncbi:MAG: hypothetical protein WBO46_03605, partial [Caldilineaceae bacterium]